MQILRRMLAPKPAAAPPPIKLMPVEPLPGPEPPVGPGAPPLFDEAALKAMQIAPEELKRRLENDPENLVVVDVRETRELGGGIIPDALNFPMSELEKHVGELPGEKEIVCYCQHGARSLSAAAFLTSMGFRAKCLRDGIGDWNGPRTEPQG